MLIFRNPHPTDLFSERWASKRSIVIVPKFYRANIQITHAEQTLEELMGNLDLYKEVVSRFEIIMNSRISEYISNSTISRFSQGVLKIMSTPPSAVENLFKDKGSEESDHYLEDLEDDIPKIDPQSSSQQIFLPGNYKGFCFDHTGNERKKELLSVEKLDRYGLLGAVIMPQ